MKWFGITPGLIAAAIQALWGEHSTNGEPVDGITAIEVHEFRTMVEKTKKCALLQVILNEMRLAEVALLLHQAEETSDAENYVTAIKFASTLTTTHATKYTYIHARFGTA